MMMKDEEGDDEDDRFAASFLCTTRAEMASFREIDRCFWGVHFVPLDMKQASTKALN